MQLELLGKSQLELLGELKMMVILAMKEGPAEVLQLVLVYLGSEVLVSCLGLSVLAVWVEQLVVDQ